MVTEMKQFYHGKLLTCVGLNVRNRSIHSVYFISSSKVNTSFIMFIKVLH